MPNVNVLAYIQWCVFLTLNLLNSLNRIIHLPFLEQSIIIFKDIKMVRQQYRAWSDCTDMQAGKCSPLQVPAE